MSEENGEMPLMMDNPMGEATMQDLGVDDLFGDGVPLHLPPPGKRLQRRLDELRGRGCCQGLAWSKTGTIASIAPDGQSLDLSYLRADPKDGTWGLSEPTTINPWPNLAGGPVVHLSWGPTHNGSELAVIDAVGRVLIFNFSTNLNRPTLSRRWDSDPLDDLHTVVGTYWLHLPGNAQKLNPLYTPAIRAGTGPNGNTYQYDRLPIPSNPPFHPNPVRSSLVCITANGLLKLFWTQNTGKVEETLLELESVDSADDLITHAAVCGDAKSKTMWVAMATRSNHLRLAQVGLGWGLPKESAPNMPPTGPQALQITPQLHQRHFAATSWLPQNTGDSHHEGSMTQISHIEVLPSVADFNPNAPKTPPAPTIITVRSSVPGPDAPYNQETQSVIDRWELASEPHQTLHPAFEQLGNRRSSIGSSLPTTVRLKRLEPIIVNKVVVGITVVSLGRVICFSYSDGSVEHRDRETMNELYTELNFDRVSSILETGFTQPGEQSCLQTALSPTNLSLVQMTDDGKVKWHGPECHSPDPATMEEPQVSAVSAALTMAIAQSIYSGANIDDILAVARLFAHREGFVTHWMNEMVSLLRMTADYSEDAPHDHLFRNNQLQHCYSVLNHLGWNGEFRAREFRSKLSFIALNLRNIVILITIANNTGTMRAATTPMDDPDVVNTLAGCCKWSIDLLAWLCDSLFRLSNDIKFMSLVSNKSRFSQMNDYLRENNEVALHLVLCSSIRGLLQAVCRRITLLDGMSQRAVHHYERNGGDTSNGNANGSRGALWGSPLHLAYRRIQNHTSSSLINVKEFEALLTALGAEIRTAYKPNKSSQPQTKPEDPQLARGRQHSEMNLLLGQSPPNTFQDPVHKFFNSQLREFREKTDPADLYFANYELLEIDDAPLALAKRQNKGAHVDMFRRVQITRSKGEGGGETPWRRCVRCANVMEDFGAHQNKPNLGVVLSQQRNCSCGGRMALL